MPKGPYYANRQDRPPGVGGMVTPSGRGGMADSLSRRSFLTLAGGTVAAIAGLGLVECGGSGSPTSSSDGSGGSTSSAAASLSGTVNCSGAASF
jgi:hypothetical protein